MNHPATIDLSPVFLRLLLVVLALAGARGCAWEEAAEAAPSGKFATSWVHR